MDQTIDEYIAQFPKGAQAKLRQVRRAIKSVAPDSVETISYGIPTFKLLGENLVHFAGWKSHVGFYPTSSGILKFRDELTQYELSRGTVKFPLEGAMPRKLIERITKFRISEVKARFAERRAPGNRRPAASRSRG